MILPAFSLLPLISFIPSQLAAQTTGSVHQSFFTAIKENYVFLVSRLQYYLFSSVPDLPGGNFHWFFRFAFLIFLFFTARKFINKNWLVDFKCKYLLILSFGLIASYLLIFNLLTPDLIKWNHTSNLFFPLSLLRK
jgi:hypothetical protein